VKNFELIFFASAGEMDQAVDVWFLNWEGRHVAVPILGRRHADPPTVDFYAGLRAI
jgi:hypothetical protein